MYIFELIAQYLKPKTYTAKYSYDPMNENEVDEDSENCEHLFLPLDSSNEHFACKYCGLVVPKEQLKNKNIFENKSF